MVIEKNKKKLLRGKVISNKMDKTAVVEVERSFKHPRLEKIVRVAKNYKVHDENNVAEVGNIVDIYEGRPVSKSKFMYLEKVIKSQA
ncbi:MAG: 30S ribosomal protein S17 [candidate division TM6 bacterium GW2011_GWF2_32_72]|nr:MAG: 30S ribosomal protein S17 [candidate division TM6 bacterium GW2011_GWF2_32_72]